MAAAPLASRPLAAAIAGNGDVFLAEPGAARITLLRDSDGDGDGRADMVTTFADGLDRPHNLAFHADSLYVGQPGEVLRFAYQAGQARAAAPPVRVTPGGALGSRGGHWSRNIVFAPDGRHFFVAVGSRGNVEEGDLPRASVQRFATDDVDQVTDASGLRNPVVIAFYPGSERLFVVVTERDGLGDGLVPDFLTEIRSGDFFGWPYAYVGPHPDPTVRAAPARSRARHQGPRCSVLGALGAARTLVL
ncbi:MAG: hypothetical protein EXQ85_03620 [Alphaproteobacteria bacterium]|nr:hypothetical protein [Alphaproteobacteria bacterium]